MPTSGFAGGKFSVGMTVSGIDHEAELLTVGISQSGQNGTIRMSLLYCDAE
jgi:hypothetical protein